ncbi:DUF305 domain-containing protein [uncultured Arthrobacter sp.]|uniref:DUF305 domain-containing protein n=1 Tax=uncultured Arthrobacter sp. TaxID=114050 RepID=UPI0026264A24|nr:DUF305 domain-containing protein [uncultured Arthrobacter sp.]
MKNINKRNVSAVAASAVLATGAFTGTGLAVASPALADAPAQSEQVASYEVDFLKNMIDHHTMAIMMGQTCLEKATHDELVQLCSSIIASQSAQVDQMQGWLQDWYGISYSSQLSTGDMRSMQRMENFTGAQYEIRFMQSMIRHHWAAVRESGICLENAGHPELLSLCGNIRQTQLEEIGQMQSWLEDWYDRQGGRPSGTV